MKYFSLLLTFFASIARATHFAAGSLQFMDSISGEWSQSSSIPAGMDATFCFKTEEKVKNISCDVFINFFVLKRTIRVKDHFIMDHEYSVIAEINDFQNMRTLLSDNIR